MVEPTGRATASTVFQAELGGSENGQRAKATAELIKDSFTLPPAQQSAEMKRAIDALRVYLTVHGWSWERRKDLVTLLHGLSDGVASKADFDIAKSFANLSQGMIDEIKAGTMPEGAVTTIRIRAELVRAFHELLESQPPSQSAWEGIVDGFKRRGEKHHERSDLNPLGLIFPIKWL